MVILLMSLSLIVLAMAGIVMFGLPYYLNGQLAVAQWRERPENRIIAGVLVTAAVCVLSAPMVMSTLISGGANVHVIAQQIFGMSWQG